MKMDDGGSNSGGGGDPLGQNNEQSQRTPQLPAKKTAEDFIFGKLLGEGSFSSVYLAKDVKSNKECASELEFQLKMKLILGCKSIIQ